MDTGTTAQRVATNLRRIREARGFSLRGLSDELKKYGWNLSADAINKIENGRQLESGATAPKQVRRADVDDLVALALALNVSPLSLLLPHDAGDEPVYLTPRFNVTGRTAWAWGTAQQAAIDDEPESSLDLGDGAKMYTEAEYERRQAFYRAQEAFLPLAQPAEIRQELSRGEGHRAVRTARDLVESIRNLVAPGLISDPAAARAALLARRMRGARRLYDSLGRELEEIEEQLPPIHSDTPLPEDGES